VNISHSDIGLVGFYLVAEGEKVLKTNKICDICYF